MNEVSYMGDALWGRTWAERCSAGDAEFDSIKFDFETWKTTNQITKRMQIFINKCLIRIRNIKWTIRLQKKNYEESPNRSQ